jgi:hypothetical protein
VKRLGTLAKMRDTDDAMRAPCFGFVERVEGEGAVGLEVLRDHREQRVELIGTAREPERLVRSEHQRELLPQLQGAGIVGDHDQPFGVSQTHLPLEHERAE